LAENVRVGPAAFLGGGFAKVAKVPDDELGLGAIVLLLVVAAEDSVLNTGVGELLLPTILDRCYINVSIPRFTED
jgi:hypothetical protein